MEGELYAIDRNREDLHDRLRLSPSEYLTVQMFYIWLLAIWAY